MTIQWSSSEKLPGGAPTNLLPEDAQPGPEQPSSDELQKEFETYLTWRTGKGKGKGKGDAKGKGKGKSEPRCLNCAGNHPISQCPKPLVPMNQRPCFKCLKTGHMFWQCPEKGKGANALEQGGDVHSFMLISEHTMHNADIGTNGMEDHECCDRQCDCPHEVFGAKRGRLPKRNRFCNRFSEMEVTECSSKDESSLTGKWEPIPADQRYPANKDVSFLETEDPEVSVVRSSGTKINLIVCEVRHSGCPRHLIVRAMPGAQSCVGSAPGVSCVQG